ncbi:peptidase M19 [Deltaproteobacteria bacterium Smac51]|nr:peptidase M19 [Deltaproteobacteria bacterium Smac51]
MHIFDAHSDILADTMDKHAAGLRRNITRDHLPRLKKAGISGLVLALWLAPGKDGQPDEQFRAMLDYLPGELAETGDEIIMARQMADVERAVKDGRLYAFLGVEGLSGLTGGAYGIRKLHEIGVRMISLTWNEKNDFATGIGSRAVCRGLSDEGRKAAGLMEQLGIVMDVSHLSEKSFWDVIDCTSVPLVASHSNARAVCGAARNLTDQQIEAIAQRDGVIGLNSWGDFIDEEAPTAERALEHLDYLVRRAGIDHVGLGFDFCDYFGTDPTSVDDDKPLALTEGLARCEDVPAFINRLSQKYSGDELDKILYKNFHRVFRQVIG